MQPKKTWTFFVLIFSNSKNTVCCVSNSKKTKETWNHLKKFHVNIRNWTSEMVENHLRLKNPRCQAAHRGAGYRLDDAGEAVAAQPEVLGHFFRRFVRVGFGQPEWLGLGMVKTKLNTTNKSKWSFFFFFFFFCEVHSYFWNEELWSNMCYFSTKTIEIGETFQQVK